MVYTRITKYYRPTWNRQTSFQQIKWPMEVDKSCDDIATKGEKWTEKKPTESRGLFIAKAGNQLIFSGTEVAIKTL